MKDKRQSDKSGSRTWEVIGEIAGMVLFATAIFVFATLCCAVSGYHWE